MKKQQASDYFQHGFNCSQSVFTVFSTDFGISEDNSLKIACAFGAGMARQQYICGAVTGALMAIGLKYGKALHDEESKKAETYKKTIEFFEKFKKLNGTISCKDLLHGLDMNNSDDYARIKELGLFDTLCKKYVEDAVSITEQIMHE
jgi:C_GCAxxG_C_C family probable redox protein